MELVVIASVHRDGLPVACSRLPVLCRADVGQDAALRAEAAQQVPKAWQAYEALDFGAAGATIQAISGRANQYLEQQAPWTSLKKVLYAVVPDQSPFIIRPFSPTPPGMHIIRRQVRPPL